jgi:hypothetical protein
VAALYQLGKRRIIRMAWSPKYIDRPLRFLYDPEVWGICFIVMGGLMLCGMNQALAVGVIMVLGAGLQRVVDHHKPGYILHLLYASGLTGLLRSFPRYGKYRF